MRLQIAIPEAHVSKPVLDAGLEAVTRLNEQMLRRGDTPSDLELIARGARWKPEPPGQEHFDHGAEIARRGDGDCDDWAPLRAARLRVTGEDPGAIAEVRKSGAKRWHATVTRSDGSEDDPSLDAGMPGPARAVGALGATVPLMHRAGHGGVHGVGGGTFIARPRLALRPIQDRQGQVEAWQARADLPWHWAPGTGPGDVAMVSLHQSPVPDQAIVGAVLGAYDLGLANEIDGENLTRLEAIADACEGATWEDLAEMYGPEHATAAGAIVGSFFGKAFRKIKKIAKPFAKGALSIVPGGGIAKAAFNLASPLLKKNIVKQRHKPPAERKGIPISPLEAQRVSPMSHLSPAGGGPQWLPYPYPLPYPVPGWMGPSSGAMPGVAWPPR